MTSQSTELPSFEALLEAIPSLDEEEKVLFKAIATSVKGDTGPWDREAKRRGMQPHSLSTPAKKLYDKLGLPNVTGRKPLIIKVWTAYCGRGGAEPSLTPKDKAATKYKKSAETKSQIDSLAPLLLGGNALFTVQIPDDVVDIDIVSAAFNGQGLAGVLRDAIKSRRNSRFNDRVLMVTPTSDPGINMAHVVFYEREK